MEILLAGLMFIRIECEAKTFYSDYFPKNELEEKIELYRFLYDECNLTAFETNDEKIGV